MWVLLRFKNRSLLIWDLLALVLVAFLPRWLALVIWGGVFVIETFLQIQKIFNIQVWLHLVWLTLWSIVFFYILTGEWEARFLFFSITLISFIVFRIYEEFRVFKLYIAGIVALEIELFLFLLLGILYYLLVRNLYLVVSWLGTGIFLDLGLVWLAFLFTKITDLSHKGLILILLIVLLWGKNIWIWDFGIYFTFLIGYFIKHLPHVVYGAENLLGIKWFGSTKQIYIYQLLFIILLLGFLLKLFIPNF